MNVRSWCAAWLLGATWTTPVWSAPENWRLVALPAEAEDAASARARAAGATGEGAIPACRRTLPGVVLCVARSVPPTQIAMRAELDAAGTSADRIFTAARDGVERAWATDPAGTYSVEGVKGQYFVRAAGDGFDAAGLLRPELLARLAGGVPVVGVPEDGTLVWWVPGDADFDKMVAVGVRRMSEASSAPVSARLYQHTGEQWTVWAEVRGKIDLPTPAPPTP